MQIYGFNGSRDAFELPILAAECDMILQLNIKKIKFCDYKILSFQTWAYKSVKPKLLCPARRTDTWLMLHSTMYSESKWIEWTVERRTTADWITDSVINQSENENSSFVDTPRMTGYNEVLCIVITRI